MDMSSRTNIKYSISRHIPKFRRFNKCTNYLRTNSWQWVLWISARYYRVIHIIRICTLPFAFAVISLTRFRFLKRVFDILSSYRSAGYKHTYILTHPREIWICVMNTTSKITCTFLFIFFYYANSIDLSSTCKMQCTSCPLYLSHSF